jgi:acyl-CoA-binding protein
MSDLKARFEQAVAESKQLPEKPDNMTLLKIYALYKQASAKATWTASAPASPTWWAAPSGTPGTA